MYDHAHEVARIIERERRLSEDRRSRPRPNPGRRAADQEGAMDVWLVMKRTEDADHVVSVHPTLEQARVEADRLQPSHTTTTYYYSGPWTITKENRWTL